MKKKYYIIGIIVIIFLIILGVFFNKKPINDELKNTDDKENLKKETTEIVNIVKNNEYDHDVYNNEYNMYYIQNNSIMGNNLNSLTNEYDFNLKPYSFEYKYIKDGFLAENKNGELYVSINNDDYCVIKDFKDDDLKVFDKDDSNCHIEYINGSELYVFVLPTKLYSNTNYENGNISDEPVSLISVNNLLDNDAATYEWYRNGELIEGANISTYTVNKEVEDATYTVKVTTPSGKMVMSEPINVKISRKIED